MCQELLDDCLREEDELEDGDEDEEGSETRNEMDVFGAATTRARIPLLMLILADTCGLSTSTSTSTASKLGHLTEQSLQGMFDLLHSVVVRITAPEMLEMAVTCVSLMDRVLELMRIFIEQSEKYPAFEGLELDDALTQCRGHMNTLCDRMLRRSWTDSVLKRRYKGSDIGFLVEMDLKWALSAQVRVDLYANELFPQVLGEEDTNAPLVGFETLTPSSFTLFYNPLFQVLTKSWEHMFQGFAEVASKVEKFWRVQNTYDVEGTMKLMLDTVCSCSCQYMTLHQQISISNQAFSL